MKLFKINKDKDIKVNKDKSENVEEKKVIRYDLNKIFDECIKHFATTQAKSLNLLQRKLKTKEAFIKEVEIFFANKYVSKEDRENLTKRFMLYIDGYYVLEELINDKTISDIKIMSPTNVRIKRNGKRFTSNVKFIDDDDLKRFVNIIAVKNKVNLSRINAIQSFTDTESNKDFRLRFNIATEFINSNKLPCVHIRKIPKVKYTKEELIKINMLTEEQMEYLISKVRNGQVIIFTGKGASGKTTLMNVLLDEIEDDKSGLVIQENDELFSYTHPEMNFQHIVSNAGEGKIEHPFEELAINGLLTDLDYFIIGEIKGGEAMYFLVSANTGHQAMTSVHGNSANEAMSKLIDYMTWESKYNQKELMKMFRYMDTTICFMKDFKVAEISNIVGYSEDKEEFIYKDIFKGKKRIA